MPIHYLSPPEDRGEDSPRPADLEQILANLRSLYTSGVPLFTKQALVDVQQQFHELHGKSGKVHVKGIDGSLVHFTVKPGWILPSRPDDLEETLAYDDFFSDFQKTLII
jgi:hypothetical protein